MERQKQCTRSVSCRGLNLNTWPPETLHAEFRTTVPGITSKENQSQAVLRALALEETDKHYPAASWTHIYTDGSAENAKRNGGCGAYIKRPGKPPLSVSAPGGILCSNYKAEVLASHHFVGREAQESSLPHRLTISPASLHVW